MHTQVCATKRRQLRERLRLLKKQGDVSGAEKLAAEVAAMRPGTQQGETALVEALFEDDGEWGSSQRLFQGSS